LLVEPLPTRALWRNYGTANLTGVTKM